MDEVERARTRRPRTVTWLGGVLTLIGLGAMALLAASAAARSFALNDATWVAGGFAIASPLAAVGVLAARRFGLYLALAVGAAVVVGGAILLWRAVAEWSLPGSFAVLLLPPAAIALVVGGFVLIAAFGKRAHFTR
jgi:hypothetical protein